MAISLQHLDEGEWLNKVCNATRQASKLQHLFHKRAAKIERVLRTTHVRRRGTTGERERILMQCDPVHCRNARMPPFVLWYEMFRIPWLFSFFDPMLRNDS